MEKVFRIDTVLTGDLAELYADADLEAERLAERVAAL